MYSRYSEYTICKVSIDIGIQPLQNALRSQKTLAFWRSKICSGFVKGLIARPPCKSFAANRWRKGGTQPLRDLNNMWGCSHLTGKQLQEDAAGNL